MSGSWAAKRSRGMVDRVFVRGIEGLAEVQRFRHALKGSLRKHGCFGKGNSET